LLRSVLANFIVPILGPLGSAGPVYLNAVVDNLFVS